MKRIIAVMLAVVLIISGLSSVAYAQPVNEVEARFETRWEYWLFSGDTFTDGEEVGHKEWYAEMGNNPDETGAPVTALTLSLDSDLTYEIWDEEYLTEMGPPTYVWSFGDVAEDDFVRAGVQFFDSPHPFSVTFIPGFDASRSADKTEFSQSDGTQTQTLTITVTPRQEGVQDLQMKVWADEDDLVNAVIISPTTDEEQGIELDPDGRYLCIELREPERDTTYTFIVTIEVIPKVPHVAFMPQFGVDWREHRASGTTSGSSVTYPVGDPADELGTWTWSADGSYEWQWKERLVREMGFIGYSREIAPVAKASVDPYLAPVGSEFAFDGSDSYHPDGTITSWDWDFGDGSSGSDISVKHSYAAPGLYDVVLTVTDDIGAQDTDTVMVVVYDPTAGFATGGGWFIPGGKTSYNDDYLPNIDGTSPANFGFVVKYKKGASTPDGQLEFQYQQGDFNLHSSGMEWLVITNKNWAKFHGLATIKGMEGLYPFQVDARDGDFGGRIQPDRFIIKVYKPRDDPDQNEPIYKASGNLERGNIVIHAQAYEVTTTLRLQTWLASGDPLMEPLVNFASAVEQGTEGSVRIELYPSDALVPFGELAQAVAWGDVEMGLMFSGQLRDFSHVVDAGALPFLYNDDDGLMAAVRGGIGDLMSEEIKAHNITVLDWTTWDFFHLFSKDMMLARPDDVVGMTIRAYNMQAEAITAWGGNPVWWPLEEIYTELEYGELDGVTNSLHACYAYALFEVAPYFCVNYAFGDLEALCINSDVWKRLDGKTKDIMTEAAGDYVKEMMATVKELDAEALQQIQAYEGVEVYTLTPAERLVWRDASLPVWKRWLEEVGDVGQQIIDIALAHNPLP